MASTTNQLVARHALQRLPSPSGLSMLLHFVGICCYSGSYWYLINFPTMVNDSYGWHWQYLTIIGLTMAMATSIVGLMADLTFSPRLFALKNTMSLCSAPLEVLISILYWGISAIDRELVVPPEIHLAPVADIGFHAAPSILLTLDLLLFSPPWTIHPLEALSISTTIAFGYWAWVEQCFKHNGWYPYPLFALLDTTQRICLFAAAACLMTASTIMLKWMYTQLNGPKVVQESARSIHKRFE